MKMREMALVLAALIGCVARAEESTNTVPDWENP
jgi:hypothetical protein